MVGQNRGPYRLGCGVDILNGDPGSTLFIFALPFDVQSALCSLDSRISMEGDVVRVKRYTAMGEHFETVQVSLFASELNVLSGSFDTQWSEPYYPNGEECDGDLGCRSGNVTGRVE